MWEILHNNADWNCFQDSGFAGDLEDLKSTSGGTSCIFGNHTFVSKKLDVQETDICFTQFNGI